MSNTIINENNDMIGYYSDLVSEIKDNAKEAIISNEYEQAEDMIETLRMLDEHTDYDGLLVISEHNGMGFTVEQYKEGQ